jgi:hypothetical protein
MAEVKQEVQDWEQKEKTMIEKLMRLPDFDRLPFPDYIYKKYNLKKPGILSIMESLALHNTFQNAPGDGTPLEIRGPAPGGVREVLADKPLEIETKMLDESKDHDDQKEQQQVQALT